jgi:hypothetical protein
MVLKNLTFEVPSGSCTLRTDPVHVPVGGTAMVNQVLLVKKAKQGQPILLTAVKPHKVQLDALLGTAEIEPSPGKQKVDLIRAGQTQGTVLVHVQDSQFANGDLSKRAQYSGQSNQSLVRSTWLPGCQCLEGLQRTLGLAPSKAAAFMAQKAKEPGVILMASGLMFKRLRRGRGLRHPRLDSPCVCHYRGTLADGTEFDSSYATGKPVEFIPGQLIKGWHEALQYMVEGDKWEIFIPPRLAYGSKGAGSIPGGAALVFELELVKIKRK